MEIKVNSKVLSIKHYVNYNVKPKMINDRLVFRVYSQIVYDTKSTKFKAFDSVSNVILIGLKEGEELSGKLLYNKFPDLKRMDKLILNLLENEILEKKEKFNLKGFSKRIRIYLSTVYEFIPHAIYARLILYLGDKFTYNNFIFTFSKAKSVDEVIKILGEEYNYIIDEMPIDLQSVIVFYRMYDLLNDKELFAIKCYEWMLPKSESKIKYIIKRINDLKIEGLNEKHIRAFIELINDVIKVELNMTEK